MCKCKCECDSGDLFSLNILMALPFKVWGTHLKKEINTFIQQECIKLIKSKNKDISMIKKKLYFK